MYDIILSFITAFTLTYFAIPSIINIAAKKNLVDEPDERKAHSTPTPSLGGIGIFAGVIFSIVLWTPFHVFGDLQYLLCSFIIVFLIGAKDDILPMAPWKKLAGEILAAAILVLKSNVKLSSLYGVFGIYDIPDVVSIPFSIFVIMVIINAFNLIDGINGLSGSISTLIALVLGTWFFLIDHVELAIVAFALAGSTIAFLKYNFTPAKIFMGDTGSLLVGLICAILTIQFIEIHKTLENSIYAIKAVPAVAIGILILPLFDTLRVFVTRILKGKSPLTADRNHIHHLLIDCGLSHMQATGVLVLTNVIFIYTVFTLQNLGTFKLLIIITSAAILLTALLIYLRNRYRIKQKMQL
ncbi:MAG: undecaprenyl/decaprenyl-phosphate alpha-N-acetylglucosaminyl 1-phosphate transferase [Saprospiraceae bacterium]|nr:undecaprenyl/decaprenyl-phosphate alpha-N-acetylglucosaminyl 1-phosphate transferase [Saprospiraceae bacterium]